MALGLESLIPKKQVTGGDSNQNKEAFDGNLPRSEVGKTDRSETNAAFPRSKPFFRRPFYNRDSVFHLEVDRIKPNPYQPRREFDEEALRELSQSIREFGIIQPLVVSKVVRETELGTNVEYQLIAGERRLLAAKMASLERVPAIVRKINNEKEKLELALIENIQRSDLNPIESAKAYARLQDEFNLTQREIASRVGKSREVVANTIRLLNLPQNIQDAVRQNKITESEARALLSISDFKNQEEVFRTMIHERQEKSGRGLPPDPEKIYWEKQLEEKFGSPVKVMKNGGRGKMVIQFFSEEEWREILKKLLGGDSEISG